MHIIVESVLMPWTENYQNWSMLVEATACQSWHIFLRHSVLVVYSNDEVKMSAVLQLLDVSFSEY